MIMKQGLNILVQSSDYYAPFAGVLLTSLFENNQAPQYHGAYTTYYKIFALSVIKDKIDRLIYLDSDMVVNGSISELMTCDLEDNALGMCIDTIPSKYQKLIRCNSEFYYNTGMVVFDAQRWAECRGADRIIKHLINVHATYPMVDQDLLNIVLSGQIATVPQKYNCYPVIYVYKDYKFLKKAYGISKFYSEEEVISAKQNPIILHCLETFGLRPWHEGEHPYKSIWSKYLKISPWCDFNLLRYNAPVMNKVQKFLFKVMPKSMFAIINKNCVFLTLLRKVRKCGLLRGCRCQNMKRQ